MESDHEGSLGSDAMEEELDEDIYGTQDTKQNGVKADPDAKPLPLDVMKTEESEEDDDDEDSDLDIIIESNDPAATTQPVTDRFGQATVKTETPSQTQKSTSSQPAKSTGPSTSTPQSAAQASLHLPTDLTLKDGRLYPEHRTSKIEVNGDPMYNGKPISDLDIDVDLAEHLKPWRVPGADPADWFNYGFDEFTYAQYQMKRKQMAGEVQAMPSMDNFFQNMMQGMMPGMGDMAGQQQGSGTPNSMNAGAPQGMGGMPDEQTMMAMMQQAMGMQGGNPMQGNPMQGGMPGGMQNNMQGMGGPGPVNNAPSGPAGWQQGGGGGGGGGGNVNRRGGRGGHRGW